MARLKKGQWLKAQILWESNTSLSYQRIGEIFGVSKQSVIAYAKRNDWAREENTANNVANDESSDNGNIDGSIDGNIGADVNTSEEPDTKGVVEDDNFLVKDDIDDEKIKLVHGGIRPGAGRPKGALGELNLTIKERAAIHGNDAINVLADIMNDEDVMPHVRTQAADKLLDRGYGKPPVYVDVEMEQTSETSIDVVQNFIDVMAKSKERGDKIRAERRAQTIEGEYRELNDGI